MIHTITLHRGSKTCASGNIIRECTVTPAPGEDFVSYLRTQGEVSITPIGDLIFFRIEWGEELLVKGMIGDEIVYVSHARKFSGNIEAYLAALLQAFEENDPAGAARAYRILHDPGTREEAGDVSLPDREEPGREEDHGEGKP